MYGEIVLAMRNPLVFLTKRNQLESHGETMKNNLEVTIRPGTISCEIILKFSGPFLNVPFVFSLNSH